jgi:hypothetical protein
VPHSILIRQTQNPQADPAGSERLALRSMVPNKDGQRCANGTAVSKMNMRHRMQPSRRRKHIRLPFLAIVQAQHIARKVNVVQSSEIADTIAQTHLRLCLSMDHPGTAQPRTK